MPGIDLHLRDDADIQRFPDHDSGKHYDTTHHTGRDYVHAWTDNGCVMAMEIGTRGRIDITIDLALGIMNILDPKLPRR